MAGKLWSRAASHKRLLLAGSGEKFYPERMPGLPPLHALRAFEAAARHLSMKDAAAELSVTPGAVSQLVRGLEARLGTQLFRRNHRSLVLTEAGQSYFAPIRHAFRQIAEATRRLRALPNASVLTLSAPPAFAASWLVPRLGGFRARHPDIELNIATTRGLANFASDGVDLAIRHGLGRYPGLRCDRIAGIALVPVCSPGFLASLPARPRRPADLIDLPLLHDVARQDWALWFQAQGVADAGHAAARGISFDDQMLLIRAAASHQGIALVSETLARPELEQRSLVRAIDVAWPQEFAYWLVCPRATAEQPKIAAFRTWLLSERARPARRAARDRTPSGSCNARLPPAKRAPPQ
jgi:LysR family glycine cleavage system transcriptional activator